MIKNSARNAILVLAVLLASAALILIASSAETCIQGPLNVPGDIDFKAYLPGRYSLYLESTVDTKAKNDATAVDNRINEILQCRIWGCGHLSQLIPAISYTGGTAYCLKDPESGKYKIGMPFAEFEILWPGAYHMHAEFSGVVDKHPNITVGPKYLIVIAVFISIIAQIAVLFHLLKRNTIG